MHGILSDNGSGINLKALIRSASALEQCCSAHQDAHGGTAWQASCTVRPYLVPHPAQSEARGHHHALLQAPAAGNQAPAQPCACLLTPQQPPRAPRRQLHQPVRLRCTVHSAALACTACVQSGTSTQLRPLQVPAAVSQPQPLQGPWPCHAASAPASPLALSCSLG